jgi:hypothetical protein
LRWHSHRLGHLRHLRERWSWRSNTRELIHRRIWYRALIKLWLLHEVWSLLIVSHLLNTCGLMIASKVLTWLLLLLLEHHLLILLRLLIVSIVRGHINVWSLSLWVVGIARMTCSWLHFYLINRFFFSYELF